MWFTVTLRSILDTNCIKISLPPDKLAIIPALLKTRLPRIKANKRQILSLVDTLQHTIKVMQPSRSLVSNIQAW